MTRTLTRFFAACAALAVPALGIAFAAFGIDGLIACAVATAVCVVPAAIALVLVESFAGAALEQKAGALLAGSAVRTMTVLGVSAVLTRVFPRLTAAGDLAFWGWVILFYLFALGWEVFFVAGRLVAGRPEKSVPAGDAVAR